MEPIYSEQMKIEEAFVDRFGRMRPSAVLYAVQRLGGHHSELMQAGANDLTRRHMFWAVTRHRVQISKLPQVGQTIRVETWPLPPTRATFPRSVVAYDEAGNECFRAISLWVTSGF